MKRVLVPVDGSDCSLRAVDYVVGDRALCAAADGYEVHLLNVQAPLPRDVTQFVGHAQVADFHRAESERALAAGRGGARESRCSVHSARRSGPPRRDHRPARR